MKKKTAAKALLAMSLMASTLVSGMHMASVSAATYDIEIKGGTYEVDPSQLKNGQDVSFTFKADSAKYDGVIVADYILQYDPVRMDLPVNLIKQEGVIQANPDFNFNDGTKPAAGMLWVSMSNTQPSQNYDLKMKATNLFKDGNRLPITINVITNHADNVFAVNDGTVVIDSSKVKSTPVTIKLKDITVAINGSSTVKTGTNNTYTATVSNTLKDNSVNWTIEGAKDAGTKVDANGKVTVATTEKATSINVIATSKEDGTKKASKTVSITTADVPVDPTPDQKPDQEPSVTPTPDQKPSVTPTPDQKPSVTPTQPGETPKVETTTSTTKKNNVVSTSDVTALGIYALATTITGTGAVIFAKRKSKGNK